jgi:hypothetical protein
MNTRTSYDYATPTTLVLIISDALDSLSPNAGRLSITFTDTSEIVTDAYSALTANVGTDEAHEMLLEAGIGPEELDAVWPAS